MNREKLKAEIESLTKIWATMPTTSELSDLQREQIILDKISRLTEYLEYSN